MNGLESSRKVYVVTGNSECINNLFLAASLERFLDGESCTYVDNEDEADILVLNVCNVMVETPDLIRRYREKAGRDPSKQVLVLGCAPGNMATSKDGDNFHVIPFGQLVREPSMIGPRTGFSSQFSLPGAEEAFSTSQRFMLLSSRRFRHPRHEYCFITIGSGCEGQCTYCSIRSGRGAARSVEPDVIVAEARAGMDKGRFRLVLITDDAGCWGHDLGMELPDLLSRLADACPDALYEILDFNPRNLPGMFDRLLPFVKRIDHMYIPLQSGSDRILRLMKRGYRAGRVLAMLRRIKDENPEVFLESDFIVGFPSSTPEDFLSSVEAAKTFDSVAFMPFVPKSDTPAALLPDRVGTEEIQRRMDVVRGLKPMFAFKAIDPFASQEAYGHIGKVKAVVKQGDWDGRPLVIERKLDRPILGSPPQPCLSKFHSIDITSGGPFPISGMETAIVQGAPTNEIVLYSDAPDRLEMELDKGETPPVLVFFSPYSEPFIPDARVLDVLYRTMKMLLERGIFVLVETCQEVPDDFLSLFARHVSRVKLTMGLSTADDRIREMIRPQAAPVASRLATLRKAVEMGIPCEIGLGPLTPELEDSEPVLTALCTELAACGVQSGSVSFLQLGPSNHERLAGLKFGDWSFLEMTERLYTHRVIGRMGEAIRMTEPDYRRRKFREIRAIAKARGLKLSLCLCNDLDRSKVPATDIFGVDRHLDTVNPESQVDDLMEFVVAGTDLGSRLEAPVATTDPTPDPDAHAHGAHDQDIPPPSDEVRIPVGPDIDDERVWDVVRDWMKGKEDGGLLPARARLIHGLLLWLGRNGLVAEAFLSTSSLLLVVADPDGDGDRSNVEISPQDEGRSSFLSVGDLGVSYHGKSLTPAIERAIALIAKYLTAVWARAERRAASTGHRHGPARPSDSDRGSGTADPAPATSPRR